jgi:hypothetical protein
MSLILGEFIVMAWGFFVVILVLVTCIDVQSKDREREDRADCRRRRRCIRERELVARKRLEIRYR